MTQLRTIDTAALAQLSKALVGFDRYFTAPHHQNGNYPPQRSSLSPSKTPLNWYEEPRQSLPYGAREIIMDMQAAYHTKRTYGYHLSRL